MGDAKLCPIFRVVLCRGVIERPHSTYQRPFKCQDSYNSKWKTTFLAFIRGTFKKTGTSAQWRSLSFLRWAPCTLHQHGGGLMLSVLQGWFEFLCCVQVMLFQFTFHHVYSGSISVLFFCLTFDGYTDTLGHIQLTFHLHYTHVTTMIVYWALSGL